MTPTEAAALLTICAGFDNRKPDADTAKAWSMVLDGLRFIDCRDAAVAHYRESRDWLMPADIVKGVRRMRDRRIVEYGPFDVPSGLNDREYHEFVAAKLKGIADGDDVRTEPLSFADAGKVMGELSNRGLRTNALQPERIGVYATRIRDDLAQARAAMPTKPEPAPLTTPADRLVERADTSTEGAL